MHAHRILPLILALLVSALASRNSRANQIIDPQMHHLRFGNQREWSEFPEQSEGNQLALHFKASANAAEQMIRLRQRDVKQTWSVRLNDKPLGSLTQDENAMVSYFAVPARALREGDNELQIGCDRGDVPDDVMVGDISLISRPRTQALAEATLKIEVIDSDHHNGIPCRITIADEQSALMPLGNMTGDNGSGGKMAVRTGVVYSSNGHARLALPAGDYVVYGGRGFEYSVDSVRVHLDAAQTCDVRLNIRHVVNIGGYVACDTHIHTFTYSRHGDCTIEERMLTLAGEGVELPVATDHNLQIDYDPPARAMGVRQFFTPVIGNEVTTASLGHFNVFPIDKGATLLNWRIYTWDALARDIANVCHDPVIILNHARDTHGGFRPFDPSRHISLTGEDLDGWKLPANAMEVLNSGATQTDPMQLFRDWFGEINGGGKLTPIAGSDSHDVSRYIVGQGRTYVQCDDTDPSRIDVDAARRSLLAGRVLVSYGLLTHMTVNDHFGPGDLVPALGEVKVHVQVLGPQWTRATRVVLYANGVAIREASIDAAKGKPQAPGLKWEGRWTLPHFAHDVFLVAIATGPGVTEPFWPTAKPYQPMSADWNNCVLGATGAVWVDAENSGTFKTARDYAGQILKKTNGDPSKLAAALTTYDESVAAQTASSLRQHSPETFEATCHAILKTATPGARRGIEEYLQQWNQTKKQ